MKLYVPILFKLTAGKSMVERFDLWAEHMPAQGFSDLIAARNQLSSYLSDANLPAVQLGFARTAADALSGVTHLKLSENIHVNQKVLRSGVMELDVLDSEIVNLDEELNEELHYVIINKESLNTAVKKVFHYFDDEAHKKQDAEPGFVAKNGIAKNRVYFGKDLQLSIRFSDWLRGTTKALECLKTEQNIFVAIYEHIVLGDNKPSASLQRYAQIRALENYIEARKTVPGVLGWIYSNRPATQSNIKEAKVILDIINAGKKVDFSDELNKVSQGGELSQLIGHLIKPLASTKPSNLNEEPVMVKM